MGVNPTHCPECSTILYPTNRIKRVGFEINSRCLECRLCGWFEQRLREPFKKKEEKNAGSTSPA